jgi:hypothetical protein
MQDIDGDGAADRVVLRFESPLESAPTFRLRWSDIQGGSEERTASTPTRTDSGGLVLVFDLPPFAVGTTACPVSGCHDLGAMVTTDASGEVLTTSFPIRDGVAPVLTRARLRYAAEEGGLDSLWVEFSEPLVQRDAVGPWISWRSGSSPGLEMPVVDRERALSSDGRSALLLVRLDSAFLPVPGDEARIAGVPAGGLSDASGVRSDSVTTWVPFEFGPRPVRIDFRALPALRTIGTEQLPAPGEPAVRFLQLDPATGVWRDESGVVVHDTSRLSGIMFEANAPLLGGVYIYDNLGIFVAHLDFAPWEQAWSAGVPPQFQGGDGRGRVWIAWNGADATGRLVGDGVYVLRMVGRLGGGPEAPSVNRQFRLGRKVKR